MVVTELQLASLLVSLSLFQTGVAIWFYVRSRRLLRSASSRSLTELDLRVTDLQSQCTLLMESHKRLQARYSMREIRDRRRAEPAENEKSNGVDREALRNIARSRGLMR